MKSQDGRARARANELKILRAMHRFGWLGTHSLGALLWQNWATEPAATGEPSLIPPVVTQGGLRMAQRTLRRMRDKRLVLSSRAPDGSVIYALAEAGARELQRIGVKAATGKDLLRRFSSSHFRHRHIANDVAISGMIEGYRASTEREISQGLWIGGKEGVAGKLPDVLLRNSSHAWWVEVERSKKKEYATLLAWIEAVRQDMATPAGPSLLGGKLVWAQVVFICRPAFRAKLSRDLAAAGWSEIDIKKLLKFEMSLYRFQDINFGGSFEKRVG